MGYSDTVIDDHTLRKESTDCGDDSDDFLSGEEFAFESDRDSDSDQRSSQSPSPLFKKNTVNGNKLQPVKASIGHPETRQFVPDGPEGIILPSDDEEMTDVTETEDGEQDRESRAETDSNMTDSEEEDDEDEWVPPPEPTPRAVKTKGRQTASSSSSQPNDNQTAKRPTRSQISKLAREMDDLSLVSDDSIILLPTRNIKAISGDEASEGKVAPVKKKKR